VSNRLLFCFQGWIGLACRAWNSRETLLRAGLGRAELRQSPSSAADAAASGFARRLPNLLPGASSVEGLNLEPMVQTSSLSAELSPLRNPGPLRFGTSGSVNLKGRLERQSFMVSDALGTLSEAPSNLRRAGHGYLEDLEEGLHVAKDYRTLHCLPKRSDQRTAL